MLFRASVTMAAPRSGPQDGQFVPPMVLSVLREHRLACANGSLGLAFLNSKGSIDHRNSIVERGFHPAQVAAGVVDRHGRAKYGGPAQPAPLLRLVVHQ